MSNTVDERVVELQFDNKQFESNVETSLGTLDKLKKALKFDKAADAFSDISKAADDVSLNSIEQGLDKLKKRFSAFGTFSARIVENFADSVYKIGSKMVHGITNTVVNKGISRAMNIEQAKFQLEGLGVAWEDVYDSINTSVSGTAYGLDEAAKVASQLVASNVELGDSMTTSLRAVSGVAAMTNSEYSDIGRIFTTVAGNGRLMGDQLQQLSARGLNVAAALGEQLGKTEGQIREMVSKGKIDFMTFASAMDAAFGEHATAANETFSGSLANMKAALGRIGAEVAGPALVHLRDVFNSLRVIIDGVHKALMPFINVLNDFIGKVANVVVKKLDQIGKAFGDVAHGGRIVTIVEIFKDITTIISNLARGIWSFIKPIAYALGSLIPPITLNNVRAFTRNLAELTSNFSLSETAAKVLTKVFTILVSPLKLLKTIFIAIGKVISVIAKGFSIVGGAIAFVVGKARQFGSDVLASLAAKGYTFSKAFSIVSTSVRRAAGSFREFAQKARTSFGKFRNLPGVQNLLKQLGAIRKILVELAGSALSWILDKIQSIGKINLTFPSFDGLAGAIDFVAGKIGDFLSLLRDGAGHVGDFFKMVGDRISSGLQVVGQYIGQGVQGLKNFFGNLEFPKLDWSFFTNLKNKFSGLGSILTSTRGPMTSFMDTIRELSGPFKEKWEKVKSVLFEFFSDPSSPFLVTNAVNTGVLATMAVGLKNFLDGFGEFGKGIGEFGKSAGTFMTDIVGAFKDFAASTRELMGNINGSLQELKGTLESYQKDIKADIIKKIAIAIVALAGAVWILSKVDPNRLIPAVTALGVLLVALAGVMLLMDKLSSTTSNEKTFSFKGFKKIGFRNKKESKTVMDSIKAMIGIAASVFVLALAVKKISEIGDMKKAGISLAILTGIVAALVGSIALLGFLDKKGKINLEGVNKAAFGMIEIGVAVLIMAQAMKGIGSLKPQQFEQGLWALIAIMTMMSLFALAVQNNGKSILVGAIGTMAIATAIMMLVPPLVILGLLPADKIKQGLLTVALLMGALGLASLLAGKGSAGGAASMIAMALAINMLLIPVFAFSKIKPDQLQQGVKAVAALAIVIGVVSRIAKGSLRGAASFAILSVSLIAVAGAVALLAQLPWEALKGAGIVLGGLMLGLAVAGVIANNATAGLLALGAAMLMFGGGLFLAGVGLTAVSAGLIAFAGALVVVGKAGPVIVDAMFAIMEAIINQLLLFLPRLTGMVVNAIGVLIWAVCSAIASNTVQIVNVILMLIVAILDAIADHMQAFTIMAIRIIVEFIRGITYMMPDIIDSGIQLMIAFMDGMADGLRRSNGQILAAVKNLLSAIIEFIISAIQEVLRLCGAVGKKAAEELEGAKEKVKETLAPETYEGQGEEIASSTAQGIENKTPEVEAAAIGMKEAATDPMDDILAKYSDISTASPQALSSGLLSGTPDVFNASSQLATATYTPMSDIVNAFENGGKLASSTITDGLESGYPNYLDTLGLYQDSTVAGMSDIEAGAIADDWGATFSTNLKNGAGKAKEAGHAIAESALDGIREQEEAVTNRGFVVGDKYADGISTKNPEAKKAGSELASNTITGIEPVKGDMWEVGNYAGQGFYRGLDGWAVKIKQKADAIARSVKEASQKALDESSPSKAMMEIGAYATEGLAIGLMKKASLVKTAAGDVAGTAKDSMQDAIRKVAVVLESLDDMHPVIQPVLDLSEIKSQAGYMNSMFGNQRFTVGARANMNDLDQLMSLAAQINQNGSSNADVVNAITDLRRDVNHLGSQMERMQVRMDTGALVGALYNPLDKELGRQVKYRTRGA